MDIQVPTILISQSNEHGMLEEHFNKHFLQEALSQ